MTTFTKILFFTTLISLAASQETTETDISQAQAWGYSFIVTVSVCIVGFLAALLIIAIRRCIKESTFKTFINMLYSLGCGAMVGDAMIHILPDSYSNPQANFRFVSLIFICSIVFFIMMERVLHLCGLTHSHWGDEEHNHGEEQGKGKVQNQHCHDHNHDRCQKLNQNQGKVEPQMIQKKESEVSIQFENKDQKEVRIIDSSASKSGVKINPMSQEIVSKVVDVNNPEQKEQKIEEGCLNRLKGKGSAGYLNILSSFLHNFFDGFAIGAAFSSMSKTQYVPVVIAIFAHQIPREMGDVGILIKNKFDGVQTIMCNVVVNLTSLIGVLVGMGLGSISEATQIYILSFVAGNFMYIGADIWRNLLKNKKACGNILEVMSFAVGVGAMYLVLLAEQQ